MMKAMKNRIITACAMALLGAFGMYAQETSAVSSETTSDNYRRFEIRWNVGANNRIGSSFSEPVNIIYGNSNATEAHNEIEFKWYPFKHWGIGLDAISWGMETGSASRVSPRLFGFDQVYQWPSYGYSDSCLPSVEAFTASFWTVNFRQDYQRWRFNAQLGFGTMDTEMPSKSFYGKEVGSNLVNYLHVQSIDNEIFALYPKASISYRLGSYFGIGASVGIIVPCAEMTVRYSAYSAYFRNEVASGVSSAYPGCFVTYDLGISWYFGAKNKK